MRDFDQSKESDLSFKIGGEEFTMRYVRPEVLSAWEDEADTETSEQALKSLDDRVKIFLKNGDSERWDKIRAREEDPVTLRQMNDLLLWMVEVQAGRPTEQPSTSASGPGKTAASSKAG